MVWLRERYRCEFVVSTTHLPVLDGILVEVLVAGYCLPPHHHASLFLTRHTVTATVTRRHTRQRDAPVSDARFLTLSSVNIYGAAGFKS